MSPPSPPEHTCITNVSPPLCLAADRRANMDNIQVLQQLWARVDDSGHTVDWHDLVRSQGLSCTFIF